MGLTLPDEEEFATLGGLIMSELNEIPRPGHEIAFDQVTFRIVEANRRTIRRVRVTITPNAKPSS
jgi:CBS domain containing-hemolysin-like protein